MRRRERMSISVPAPMAEWVRAEAITRRTTASGLIELALRAMFADEQRQRIIAGLLEDAATDRATAEASW